MSRPQFQFFRIKICEYYKHQQYHDLTLLTHSQIKVPKTKAKRVLNYRPRYTSLGAVEGLVNESPAPRQRNEKVATLLFEKKDVSNTTHLTLNLSLKKNFRNIKIQHRVDISCLSFRNLIQQRL